MKNALEVDEMHKATSWSPESVKNQIQAIQQLMSGTMQDGEHYGVIPGTNSKPTLLKAGAEKLCLMFRLAPKYQITTTPLSNGHLNIQVTCSLNHINTGAFWGEGVGFCSTMEKKYRYRTGVGASTGVQVSKELWDLKRVDAKAFYERIGKGYTTKKSDEDGKWYIHEKLEGTENTDIADTYNTVLKMAKKRALVDATLTATAASDIFSQDLEETVPEVSNPSHGAFTTKEDGLISEDMWLSLLDLLKQHSVSNSSFLAHLKETYKITNGAKIKQSQYSEISEWIIKQEVADALNG